MTHRISDTPVAFWAAEDRQAYVVTTGVRSSRKGPGHYIRDGLALVGLIGVVALFLVSIHPLFGGQ